MSSNIVNIDASTRNYRKKIKYCMKNDTYQMIPPKINDNSLIIAQINVDGEWESFLHCSIKKRILTFATGFTNIKYRRQGISTKLRLWVIANIQNIDKYESLTMPGNYSALLLEKIGFHKEGNKMTKYNI
jgi:hypothetical protein